MLQQPHGQAHVGLDVGHDGQGVVVAQQPVEQARQALYARRQAAADGAAASPQPTAQLACAAPARSASSRSSMCAHAGGQHRQAATARPGRAGARSRHRRRGRHPRRRLRTAMRGSVENGSSRKSGANARGKSPAQPTRAPLRRMASTAACASGVNSPSASISGMPIRMPLPSCSGAGGRSSQPDGNSV